MRLITQTAIAVFGLSLCSLASASGLERSLDPAVVDLSAMDQIVAESSRELRLAHKRHRRDGRRHSRRYSRRNNWVGPAVAGVILGAIIANETSKPRRHYRNYDRRDYRAAKRRCDDKYRSYDWDSDTFVTYGGKVKLCPYVKPYY